MVLDRSDDSVGSGSLSSNLDEAPQIKRVLPHLVDLPETERDLQGFTRRTSSASPGGAIDILQMPYEVLVEDKAFLVTVRQADRVGQRKEPVEDMDGKPVEMRHHETMFSRR